MRYASALSRGNSMRPIILYRQILKSLEQKKKQTTALVWDVHEIAAEGVVTSKTTEIEWDQCGSPCSSAGESLQIGNASSVLAALASKPEQSRLRKKAVCTEQVTVSS
jgi:hypothetical protein